MKNEEWHYSFFILKPYHTFLSINMVNSHLIESYTILARRLADHHQLSDVHGNSLHLFPSSK